MQLPPRDLIIGGGSFRFWFSAVAVVYRNDQTPVVSDNGDNNLMDQPVEVDADSEHDFRRAVIEDMNNRGFFVYGFDEVVCEEIEKL